MGHFSTGTHPLVVWSITWPEGHSHLSTHTRTQRGFGIVQFGGHADPQDLKTWPFMGQAVWKRFFKKPRHCMEKLF